MNDMQDTNSSSNKLIDRQAERAVIASCLIDERSITKVAPKLTAADFYWEAHQVAYAAMLRLSERNVPVDMISLASELQSAGQLELVGGHAGITEISDSVATALYVEHYASAVSLCSLRRRAEAAAQKIAQIAYGEAESEAEIVDLVEATVMAVSNKARVGELQSIQFSVKSLMDRISFLADNPMRLVGVPTGFTMLDKILGGLQKGNLLILAGRPGMGKCLGKGTKVVMFDGSLKAVEDVRVGDKLMGPDSQPRNVLSLARGREQMYWIRQKHGIDYRVNESHILSLKRSKNEGAHRRGDVLNIPVSEAKDKGPGFFARYKGYKASIDFPFKHLPLDPYFFGLWLGDGSNSKAMIYTADTEVVDYLSQYAVARREYVSIEVQPSKVNGYLITGGSSQTPRNGSIRATLGRIGVINNKHIPEYYLINSRDNRLALLAGLIDSDGHYMLSQGGPYEITLKNKRLAEQVKFLCDSLGYSTSLIARQATIASIGYSCEVYRVRFNGNVDEIPVKIERKKAKPWCDFKDWQVTGIAIEKDIVDDYYGFVIDGDHLFLLEDMTVTHNTALCLSIAYSAAKDYGARVAMFSLEMSKDELTTRLLSMATGIDSHRLKAGKVYDEEWPILMEGSNEVSKLPILLDDTAAASATAIRTKARRMHADRGLDLIVVDYMQLMGGNVKGKGRQAENRQQEVSEISRSLKQLARELDVPILALSQLSRAVESRADKRPMLSDLRESGSLEQDADVVLFVYREDYYIEDTDKQNIADIIIAKHRHGSTGTVSLFFRKELTQFVNLEVTRTELNDY